MRNKQRVAFIVVILFAIAISSCGPGGPNPVNSIGRMRRQ